PTSNRAWQRYQEFAATRSEFSAFFQIHEGPSLDWGLNPKASTVFWEHQAGDGQYVIDRSDGGKIAVATEAADLEARVGAAVVHVVAQVRAKRDAAGQGVQQ